MGDGLRHVPAVFRRGAEYHHARMLAEALGVGVKEFVQRVQLLHVTDVRGIEHRALHLDRRGCLQRRRGGDDGVGGAENALHLAGQAPCPGDDHRVGQRLLAAAVALQRQGLRQADGLGQATAPGRIDE